MIISVFLVCYQKPEVIKHLMQYGRNYKIATIFKDFKRKLIFVSTVSFKSDYNPSPYFICWILIILGNVNSLNYHNYDCFISPFWSSDMKKVFSSFNIHTLSKYKKCQTNFQWGMTLFVLRPVLIFLITFFTKNHFLGYSVIF